MQNDIDHKENDELARVALAKAKWLDDLKSHKGHIYSPDGEWLAPKKSPPLAYIDSDVWCDSMEEIEVSVYEQRLAQFMDSVVEAKYCGVSGTERFYFVLQNLSLERARGDLFAENEIYINREKVYHRPEDERTICDAFGKLPRRELNRLKKRAYTPRKNILQGPPEKERACSPKSTTIQGAPVVKRSVPLQRMCYYSIARKVFLARIGYPEFLGRHVS